MPDLHRPVGHILKTIRPSQQNIVFALFVLMFIGFALLLPGFFSKGNLLGLLQNVAILGILGLAMAVVVIGRGIDISMIAVLAVPVGLILQMVQNGHSVPLAFLAGLTLALLFGLFNGWLTACSEVPSLFTTLASGLFSLIQEPELIIFDEPTRGVDVGAITEIHELINRLADEGKAVVVISSYLPEIMALSDRILVQRMGKVVEEYSAIEATEEKIMYAAIH